MVYGKVYKWTFKNYEISGEKITLSLKNDLQAG